MAVTQTNLTADLSATSLTMTVGSGTGFPTAGAAPVTPGYPVRIDGELMYAVSQPVSGTIKLRGRGSDGTAAVSHDTLSKVEVSSDPQDFMQPPAGASTMLPPYRPLQQTIGEDITINAAAVAAINRDTEYAITKATAAAITLGAPSKAQDGLTLTFTSLTDQTHAITATSLLASAGAASPYTTATVANAKAGGGLVLKAENGLWNVIVASNWTLT